MLFRVIPPGLETETERAVAGALGAVDDLHEAYEAAGVLPMKGPETVVIVCTPNDSLVDVLRRVEEAMGSAPRVRVEARVA